MNVFEAKALFVLVDIFAFMTSSPDISKTSTSLRKSPSKFSVLIKISSKLSKHFLQPIIVKESLSLRISSPCHLSLSKLFFVKKESSNNLK